MEKKFQLHLLNPLKYFEIWHKNNILSGFLTGFDILDLHLYLFCLRVDLLEIHRFFSDHIIISWEHNFQGQMLQLNFSESPNKIIPFDLKKKKISVWF